ncbi:MAG: ABC transporter ATP-binding protein [Bacteroidia bacterium]
MEKVVEVSGVSKVFRLGNVGSSTITQDLRQFANKLRGKSKESSIVADTNDRTAAAGKSDMVWAIRDINFSVAKGEIVGLVGRNGAGKSTLLKVLSRTTAPTTGTIKIKGRVSSLLEVGTGFHPDLTGRENIYLNGTILGMRISEIKAKFDDIVQFAGVQRYIDTPVKRYSSGMYVRLAFAVAAHLDPDVLIIDEVLAVGDAEFQAKCLGKMKEVSDQGRTVLFVSHNMGAVADLCTRAILLNQGKIVMDDTAENVVRAYVKQNMKVSLGDASALSDPSVRRGNGAARFESISIENEAGESVHEFVSGETIRIKMRVKINEPLDELMASISLRAGRSRDIVTTTGRNLIKPGNFKPGDVIELDYTFNDVGLRPGVFETYFWLGDRRAESAFDVVDNLLAPIVINFRQDSDSMFIVGYFDLPYQLEYKLNQPLTL